MWEKTGVEFITLTGQKISEETTPMAILITDGVGKETCVWWPPYATTIKSKWRPLMHSPPYVNATHWGWAWWIHQHSLYSLRDFLFPLSRHEHSLSLSLWVLPLPNFHWTGCIYVGYSLSLGLRCSYLMKRGRWGQKCTPFPERFSGTVLKKNTASLSQFCCQSPHRPFIHV